MHKTAKGEINNRITVDSMELQQLLGVGRKAAEKIGQDAGAIMRVGRRKLFYLTKIEAYLDSQTTRE